MIEAVDAGGDPLVRRRVGQSRRGHRQHHDAAVGDHERVLVRAVQRSAVLRHPQPAGGQLVLDPVVQHHHTVRDVLLDAVPGQLPGPAPLAGDDHRQATVLEPAQQPAHLRADRRLAAQRGEQHLDGVQHHPLRTDRIHRPAQPDEQALQVEPPAATNAPASIRNASTASSPSRSNSGRSNPSDGHVRRQLVGRFLKGQQNARLAEPPCPPDQEFQPEQGLARPGATGHQRRPPARQAAPGDLVEAADTGRRLHQPGRTRIRAPRQSRHRSHRSSQTNPRFTASSPLGTTGRGPFIPAR